MPVILQAMLATVDHTMEYHLPDMRFLNGNSSNERKLHIVNQVLSMFRKIDPSIPREDNISLKVTKGKLVFSSNVF
jgi:hypothetical protein